MSIFESKGKNLPQGDRTYKKFLETAKYWLKELDFYGSNQFKKVTANSAWTIGQVYDHLINGTRAYHMREIRKCLEKTGGSEEGKKLFKGHIVFFLGKFPSIKIAGVDPNGYVPSQPESPDKMKDEFFKFFKEMQKIAKDLDAAPSMYKTMHPSLGMLTGQEWFQIIEMHFRHHLRQKSEIDKSIRSFYKEEDSSELLPEAEIDDYIS